MVCNFVPLPRSIAPLLALLLSLAVVAPGSAQSPSDSADSPVAHGERPDSPSSITGAPSAEPVIPSLDDLARARRLVALLSEPLARCRQQLAAEALDQQIRLGRLDSLETLAERHREHLPEADRWLASIERQRQRLAER